MNKKKKIIIEITVDDNGDSLEELKEDLQSEIEHCSHFFDVDYMKVKEVKK